MHNKKTEDIMDIFRFCYMNNCISTPAITLET